MEEYRNASGQCKERIKQDGREPACFRPFHTETEYAYLGPHDRAKADLDWEAGRRA